MTANELAGRLDSKKVVGRVFYATCVLSHEHANGDADPSLTIRDGDHALLVECQSRHKNERPRVIAELKARGLWPSSNGAKSGASAKPNDGRYEFVRLVPANAPDPGPAIEFFYRKRFGHETARFSYRDANGALLHYVLRFEPPGGKEIRPLTLWWDKVQQQFSWLAKWPPNGLTLYRLQELALNPELPALSVEGERKADIAAALLPDFVVLGLPGGAAAVGKVDFAPLTARESVLFADHDGAGFGAMIKAARAIQALQHSESRSVRMVVPDQEWPLKSDVADLIEKRGWGAERLRGFIRESCLPLDKFEILARDRFPDASTKAEQPPARHAAAELKVAQKAIADFQQKELRADITFAYSAEFIEPASIVAELDPRFFTGVCTWLKAHGAHITDWKSAVKAVMRRRKDSERAEKQAAAAAIADAGDKRESQATMLVGMARSRCELFHSGDDCFASIEVDGHLETHALKNRGFKRWLSHEFMIAHGTAPNGEALATALTTLAGSAQFEGLERSTFARVANYKGVLYLDLCDPPWRVVEIDKFGWRIVESKACPIRFRRAHGMLALPEPAHGGLVATLRKFLNVATDQDFMLVVAWLVACFRDKGPYPILAFGGEQGSAKTTNARVAREFIDPSASPLRAPPKEPRDLAIAARNAWLVGYDNLSRIPEWLSDALCRLSTGGGFSTRSLFSDDEEQIFDSQRPAVVTGVGEVVDEPDLVDRGLFLTAPLIADGDRRTEDEFWSEFYIERPRILGALLDGVSQALANIDSVVMTRKPRMADFAMWCEAAAPAFGWKPGAFLEAYQDNRTAASGAALQSVLAEGVQQIDLPWNGTSTALLAELEKQFEVRGVDGSVRIRPKPKDWPSAPNAFSGQLRKIAPNLRRVGIDVTFTHTNRSRGICLSKVQPASGSDGSRREGECDDADRPSSSSSQSSSHLTDEKPPVNPKVFANGDDGNGCDDRSPHNWQGATTEKNKNCLNGKYVVDETDVQGRLVK